MILTKHGQRPISLAVFGLSLIIIIYNIFFITYGLQKHAAFQTAGFDLGIWDQKVWGMLNASPFVITTQAETNVSLGDHVDPVVLWLLAPFYGLYDSPKTLIIVQVVFVSLGALPIFWLARRHLRSSGAGLAFAAVYLLFPALGGALTFDLHAITIATPLLAYALWAIQRQHYRLFMVLAILAMGCQEDVPLLTFMMGLYIAGVQRQWRVGSAAMAVSLLWFALANFLIIPSFSLEDDNIHLYRYEALGSSTGEVILTIITRPDLILEQIFAADKKLYWLRLTMPTAFTALFDPLTLLMTAPSLLINTLSTYPPSYQLDRFHASAPLVPFIVVASINGVARLVNFAGPRFKHVKPAFIRNSLVVMVLIVTLAYQVQFGHTPIGGYFEWPVVTEHHRQTRAMLARIPPQAALAAQNNLVSHVSQREWIFILPKRAQQGREADYIAIDMTGPLYPYDYIETYCADVQEFVTSPLYGLIFAGNGLLLFQRNAADTATYVPVPPCSEGGDIVKLKGTQ